GRLEKVGHHAIVVRHLSTAAPGKLDLAPVAVDPTVQLVEQFRLQDPLVLGAAPAEAVDAVAQGAVPLTVEAANHTRGELAVGFGPGHTLVQVDQVALV